MSAESPSQGVIEGGVHRLAARVYFEDTDTAGIVYHANYLRFMERGRTEMLRAVGIDHGGAVRDGLGAYAIIDMRIRWARPARLDDVLTIETSLMAAHGATCRLVQTIERDGETLVHARLTAAFLGPDGRPRRQPREWLERFAALVQVSD